MSRRKRSPGALATLITIGPDMVVEPTYEANPDGRPVVNHRVVDILNRDAGRTIETAVLTAFSEVEFDAWEARQ